MNETFDEELKEIYNQVSINVYGNKSGTSGMRKLLDELKNKGLLTEKRPLPTVPKCVADYMEKYRGFLSIFGVLQQVSEDRNKEPKVHEWVFSATNQKTFAMAFITNEYTVIQNPLFYLKHIDVSESNTNWGYYLKHGKHDNLEHSIIGKGHKPTSRDFVFTQAEISSMNTGSYEQIEVEE